MPETAKELSQEEIAEAIKKKWCPFCKCEESIKRDVATGTKPEDAQRRFYVKEIAWQDVYLTEQGDDDWGEIEADAPIIEVFCSDCDTAIPEEIWTKWLPNSPKYEEGG